MLLFGKETWVVSLMMEQALSAFIHGAARRLTGRQPRRGRDGKWYYPSLEGTMKEAGLTDVWTSIQRKAEHGCAVYCYATASGPVRGSATERGGAGYVKMVGKVGN